MGYKNLSQCLDDLARAGQLVRLEQPVDPYLEAAEIHRRVNEAGGPAILYANVVGCRFPLVSNLFGTIERTRFVFRDATARVERGFSLAADPGGSIRRPRRLLSAARAAWHALPRRARRGPILRNETTLDQLPAVTSWPRDGGPFITLPQVYTEDPNRPGWRRSNLGMYRVQLSGNAYERNREVGLHYQIHRGIGVHHAAALARGERLPVSVQVGGPPAMTVAAVMPLPEGLPELAFAGALGGRRVPWLTRGPWSMHAEADFCLVGYLEPALKPEGPFGDHLGYYSLAHDFPVLKVEHVFHRPGAVWPFTVVGRPPQEDSAFGHFIHQLTGPVVPSVVRGVKAVHAVDAAGVHPLMLAIGSERYAPYRRLERPSELLTQANAILGQGQMSLAKYLWMIAEQDAPELDIHDIAGFFRHVLERVDWARDLHFQTCTTIDTLDYSGTALNEGSKLVVAAVGPPRRPLLAELPAICPLPAGFSDVRLVRPGIAAIGGPPAGDREQARATMAALCQAIPFDHPLRAFPLLVVADDAAFVAGRFDNFLWVTFTRSDPAADVYGVDEFVAEKHWGCRGPLLIDARAKPHHAPPLEPDPAVVRRVETLATRGGPLHGLF